ncbi:MAG: hypothetical protein ACRDS0_01625 [Pseudonocardiaceae bacterium]
MSDIADIAALSMDIRMGPSALERGELGHRVTRVDCYDLDRTPLHRFAAVMVPGMVDQEYLLRHREILRAYLDGGGVVVFGGQLHRDWLPGASPFVALDPPSRAAYRVAEVAEHPIFAGVQPDDLTARRGVAGFFARGHHPPPAGAEVLVRLSGGQPVTYVDRVSTGGTIVLHANGDLLALDQHNGTGARVPAQLVEWTVAEARRNRRRRVPPRAPGEDASAGPVTGPLGSGLAAVYGGSGPHHRALTDYARHLTAGLVYLPDLADTDLTGVDGLIIAERLHRGLLTRAADRILALLDAGGTVIAFGGGEPLPEFLPGVRWEHRPTNYWWWLEPGAGLGLHSPTPDHALFDHLSLGDCTWHYHGVLTAPAGADVLVALPSGEALLYIDRVSTPGTLVVATLDPMSHYGSHFMPATERFLNGFLPWASQATTRSPR